jgi:hypothetical protein
MNSLRFSAHHFELKRWSIAGSRNQPCTFLAKNFRREVCAAHVHPETSFTASDTANKIIRHVHRRNPIDEHAAAQTFTHAVQCDDARCVA